MKAGEAVRLLKQAAMDFMNDYAPRLGAALAFYTIFSLAPLLTIAVSITGLWFSENASQQVFSEVGGAIGEDNARALQKMVVAPEKKGSGIFTAISAGLMLVFGATAVFVQLQDALNQIWEVKAKPGQGVMGFVRNRLLSFAMVLGIAFLLLVSLILTTAIAAIGTYFSHWFGDATLLWQLVNNVVSFGLISLLFAMMFMYVPDAKIAWRDVWFGAVVTAALFTLGKYALGMYLGKSSVASMYTAAGALIVVLLWVYYTAQIVFFGAELTQAYAYSKGRPVEPSAHAEWDMAKRMQREQAEKERERKKHRERKPEAVESFGAESEVPAAPAAVVNVRAQVPSRAGRVTKGLGGLLLLLLVLIPLEKRRAGAARGDA